MQEEQEKKQSRWMEAGKIFFETYKEADVRIYSVLIAYYFLLSFFPLLIAVGNILPYLNISNQVVMPYIEELLPPDIFNILQESIADLLNSSSGSLLSISAIGTFWAMSKGVNAIRLSLDKAYNIGKENYQFVRRLFSFLMVFFLFIAIISLMLIIGFGQTILEFILPKFGNYDHLLSTFKALKWPVTASVLFLILSMLYYFIPSAKVHLKTILPGALFTTLCWMGVTQFWGIYIKYFSKSISSYGVIGGVIFFILWLNIADTLIIVGGIINVTCERLIYGKVELKPSMIGEYIHSKMNKEKEKIE